MQKIATQLFICASVVFGIAGVLLILTTPPGGDGSTTLNIILMRILQTSVFIILPSFALSIAGKYLSNKSQ
jgi:hypothetical protein